MVDTALEQEMLVGLEKDSFQARSRPAPFNSADAPGIGPGMEGLWAGGMGLLTGGLLQQADEIRPWSYYPMQRDRQLRAFWKTEGILSGAVYSFSARISALPAKISGPPRGKKKAQELLHAVDLQRVVIDMLTQDNGWFIERVGPGQPDKPLNPALVSYLSPMDAGQVWRTFDPEFPIIYINPYTGKYHKIHYSRVISGSSCPQPDELARGIGFCAVSRALRYIQIARDIEIYKHEKVGGRFTRAVGIMSGLTPSQFNKTIEESKQIQDASGFTRYGGIPWFVNNTSDIKAQMIDLAHLPDGFDAKTDTELYVNTLALAFGTDVREFWPGQGSGATKADATVQHEKARGKGIADVTTSLERALNWGLFDALNCELEFDYTDDAEQMASAQYHFQVITNVATMQQSGNISPAQGTAMLIAAGVLDPDVLENVQEAEDSTPATTEAPYQNQDAPFTMPTQPPTGDSSLAKPPAASPATVGTPPGGIKPPPPNMKTSDMRPARKDFGEKYNAHHGADGRFTSGDGSNTVTYRPRGSSHAFRVDRSGAPLGPELPTSNEGDNPYAGINTDHPDMAHLRTGKIDHENEKVVRQRYLSPSDTPATNAQRKYASDLLAKTKLHIMEGTPSEKMQKYMQAPPGSENVVSYYQGLASKLPDELPSDLKSREASDLIDTLKNVKDTNSAYAAAEKMSRQIDRQLESRMRNVRNGRAVITPMAQEGRGVNALGDKAWAHVHAYQGPSQHIYVGTDPASGETSAVDNKSSDMKPARKELIAVGHKDTSKLHAHTDAYQAKLEALMQSFFAEGVPADGSELEARLARLKSDYLVLSDQKIDQAFALGRQHALGDKATDEPPITRDDAARVQKIKQTQADYFDGLIADLRTAMHEAMTSSKKKAKGDPNPGIGGTLSNIASGFINRIGMYAGAAWNAIWEGVGSIFGKRKQPVTRVLDVEAQHCQTCPDKAGTYPSWDDMVSAVGLPGDGSDDCGSNCRCTIDQGDGS